MTTLRDFRVSFSESAVAVMTVSQSVSHTAVFTVLLREMTQLVSRTPGCFVYLYLIFISGD